MPFQEYSPEQAALLPLPVRDVLSEKHLVCGDSIVAGWPA
jgi:hypothetical protein